MATYAITGCNGFIGTHLTQLLLAENQRIVSYVNGDTSSLDFAKREFVRMINLDCRSIRDTERAIGRLEADYFVHLAAQSSIPRSWVDPLETFETNIVGTFNILQTLKKIGFNGRILVVGAGAEYGTQGEHDPPIPEERDFRPTSFYGVSKIAADYLAYLYSSSLSLYTIRVRPFNITGPGKIGDACSDFARGMVEVERGRKNSLRVGNLSNVRDYLDVRDAVKAFATVLKLSKSGDCYNVCSGRGYAIKDLLAILASYTKRKISVEIDPGRIRRVDDPVDVGDNTRLRLLGWSPGIPIEQTLKDTLDYWRARSS